MMSKLIRPIIRRATAADYDAVIDLVRDVDQSDEYIPFMYRDYLNDKRHSIYVAQMPRDNTLVRTP